MSSPTKYTETLSLGRRSRLLAFPLLLMMVLPLGTASAQKASTKDKAPSPAKKEAQAPGLRTVVIDPGHGGYDPGTISLDKKTQEKDLALDISLKLRDKIKKGYPSVKVLMTRDSDVFVPLDERADLANDNNADLFISIHINASSSASARGFSIHVMGNGDNKNLFKNNLELTKRENSVILLEEDYSTKYQGFDPNDPESFIFFNLIQNANLENSLLFAEQLRQSMDGGAIERSRGISQNGFVVLWRASMPAALIECGFMSNSADLTTLRDEKKREQLAGDIYNGFASYKKLYDASVSVPSSKPLPQEVDGVTPKDEVKAKAEVKTDQKVDEKTKADVKPASDTKGKAQTKPDAKPKTETKPKTEKVSSSPMKESAPALTPSSVIYGTQVLATGKKTSPTDPFFKGYTPLETKPDKLYRYLIGTSTSLEEARKLHAQIADKYPGCFMVKYQDGKLTTISSRQK